jgi:hypothetical protein
MYGAAKAAPLQGFQSLDFGVFPQPLEAVPLQNFGRPSVFPQPLARTANSD